MLDPTRKQIVQQLNLLLEDVRHLKIVRFRRLTYLNQEYRVHKHAAFMVEGEMRWGKIMAILKVQADLRSSLRGYDGEVLVQLNELEGDATDSANFFTGAKHCTECPVRTLATSSTMVSATAMSHPIMVLHYCCVNWRNPLDNATRKYLPECTFSGKEGISHNEENPYFIVNDFYLHAARYEENPLHRATRL